MTGRNVDSPKHAFKDIEKLPCRSCGKTDLMPVLSLGNTPLANALLSEESLKKPEPSYPLEVVFCPNCTLIQITETVPPEILFRDYMYFSSFSDTILKEAQKIADRMRMDRKLDSSSLVVEIASNDGYLLKNYVAHGIPVLGIEPALNIARVANENGVNTLSEFFNEEVARSLAENGKRADVMHANNVLAHVADLAGVVKGFGILLKPDGVAVIEAPYVKDLIDYVEFDTIYHEHLCYYSLTALDRLFKRYGLTVQDVERIPIHGGSLRIFVGHTPEQTQRVIQLLEEEKGWGVDTIDFYKDFRDRVEKLKSDLINLLSDLKSNNARIVAYGASAKGATLLNYFGIGRETLDYVVDRSTVKQGHYTPGSHLPIYAPEKLVEEVPDYALLLTWNFAEEILKQQEEYRKLGGKFIVPIPELRVL